MVVKFSKLLASGLCIAQMMSCSFNNNKVKEIIEQDQSGFIDKKYINDMPLANIINPPTYTEREASFSVNDSTAVQIYGAGELLYDFGGVPSRYYLLGDDIEFFFKNGPEAISKRYIFPWSDCEGRGGKYTMQTPDGAVMYGFFVEDSLKRKKYMAELRFPKSSFGIKNFSSVDSIALELAIGDSDNHYVQEGKMACFNEKDPLTLKNMQYGSIYLRKRNDTTILKSESLNSIYGKATLDWNNTDLVWRKAPEFHINKIVSGSVKDKYDLSAKVRSCHTNDSIYFFLDISDANQDRIFKNKISEEQTFLDYGWIEDTKGHKVWEMNAVYSTYAGGAYKNHKIDTVLHLPKGNYKLKYVSDESHAYNDWDDAPPTIPFYGVVIYKAKK